MPICQRQTLDSTGSAAIQKAQRLEQNISPSLHGMAKRSRLPDRPIDIPLHFVRFKLANG